jgi:hypothetical protein
VTPKDIDIGYSFMDAWVGGDGRAAAAMFSPEGTFDGFQPTILPALHDWFRGGGWTFESRGCGIHGYGRQRGVVGCGFTYENDITHALGMPPVETTLSFVIGAGAIETAWYGSGGDGVFDAFAGYRGNEDVFGPVWDTFIDWIASRHPDDFGLMYDAERGYPIPDPPSIELWKRYTGEFVASPQAQAMARSIGDAGWDGVGFPPEGTAPSTPVEGELVAFYDAALGGDYVFVYADGRVISGGGIGDTNGTAREQRLTPEGIELVRSGTVEPERFLLSSNPVPASAWEDPDIKAYVPSRYAVCYYTESGDSNPRTVNGGYEYPSRVVGFFPARARDILLRAATHTYNGTPDPIECSEVTTDKARALDDILRDARFVDAEGNEIFLEVNTLLPHGEWVRTAA